MLTDLFQRHQEIIASWAVSHFDREGPDLRLKARVLFTDGSQLHIRQVVIDGAILKYAYQWQTREGILIARWDNAEHWPDIVTFPHHKHVHDDGGTRVLPSQGADLSLVMEEIATLFDVRPKSQPTQA
jgi:hypothetical protein